MKSEEFAAAMIHYNREGGPLHTKSYAFAVRTVDMFLHFSYIICDFILIVLMCMPHSVHQYY